MKNPRTFKDSALVAAMTVLGLMAGANVSVAVAASQLPPAPANPPATTASTQPAGTSELRPPVSPADKKFAMKAVQDGMAEVELGNLAQSNAQSDQVKSFGARMAKDHAAAGDKLKQIASTNGIELPARMNASSQKVLNKLQKLHGAQFDKAYMDQMVLDHKKDVKEFEQETRSNRQNDIQQFAADTLPTLQEHLMLAQSTHTEASSEGRRGAKP